MALYDTLCDVNISCKAAVDILNDLLCYEKLESGNLMLHKEEVPVEVLLTGSMSIFVGQARECGVILNVLTDGVGPILPVNGTARSPCLPLLPSDVLLCDKFKMDQVIRNLVSNALKFTPRGGAVTVRAVFVPLSTDTMSEAPKWSLLMQSRKSTRYSRKVASFSGSEVASQPNITLGTLVITVTDTGAGISCGNQKRLFNEIIQFNPEKLQAGGGSGLGLWITKSIVDLHDGRISVFSEGEGMGSSFEVEMPMMRSGVASLLSISCHINSSTRLRSTHRRENRLTGGDQIDAIPPHIETIEYDSGDMSTIAYDILVVDDSHLNRKMLLRCLRSDGHMCTEAADGLEAIEAVKERLNVASGGLGRPFDVILMDFIMPNMDGPTATEEIRAMGYTAPIFGLTGKGTVESAVRNYRDCFNAYRMHCDKSKPDEESSHCSLASLPPFGPKFPLPLLFTHVGLSCDIELFISKGANKVILKPLDTASFGAMMDEIWG